MSGHPDRHLVRARRIARVLDNAFLDPIIGAVVPGVGDLLGAWFGLYLVVIGLERRVSKLVIARMLMNLALDVAIGAIPVVGDIADAVYRANVKNLALLEARHADRKARWTDWLVLGLAVAALLGALLVPVFAVIWTFNAIF